MKGPAKSRPKCCFIHDRGYRDLDSIAPWFYAMDSAFIDQPFEPKCQSWHVMKCIFPEAVVIIFAVYLSVCLAANQVPCNQVFLYFHIFDQEI